MPRGRRNHSDSEQVAVALKGIRFTWLTSVLKIPNVGTRFSMDLAYNHEWRTVPGAAAESGNIDGFTGMMKYDLTGDQKITLYAAYILNDKSPRNGRNGTYDQIAALGAIFKF